MKKRSAIIIITHTSRCTTHRLHSIETSVVARDDYQVNYEDELKIHKALFHVVFHEDHHDHEQVFTDHLIVHIKNYFNNNLNWYKC